MALTKNLIEGLTILAKYVPNDLEAHDVCAEHDEIFAGPSIEPSVEPDEDGQIGIMPVTSGQPISEKDQKRLREIGWNYDTYVDRWRSDASA